MKLRDFNILDIGHTIQITGLVLSGPGVHYVAHFPGEPKPTEDVRAEPYLPLIMNTDDWEKFLYQSDALEVELTHPKKAIVRKSQRQIDSIVSWSVFKRDKYTCRYCGRDDVALTVDHIVTWESGGPSIQANLLSVDKRCNRARGNMPYAEWMDSESYKRISDDLPLSVKMANREVIAQLPALEAARVSHVRSR